MIQISAQGDDDSDEDVVICKLITNFFLLRFKMSMITLGKRNSVKVILEVSADHCVFYTNVFQAYSRSLLLRHGTK